MKILVVTTSFPSRHSDTLAIGGRFVLHECLAYAEAGAQVQVIAPAIFGIPDTEAFAPGVNLHRFNYFFPRRWQRLRNADGSALYDQGKAVLAVQLPFLFLGFVIAALRHGRSADILHCNWSFTALAALPLRYLFRKPIVLTTRGSDLRLIPQWLNRFVCRHIDAVIDCFGPDYRRMLGAVADNTLRLPLITPAPPPRSGIRRRLAPDEAFLFVLVSRFDHTKLDLYGMPFFSLLDVIAKLRERYHVRGVFVGDGPLRMAMEAHAAELGLTDLVRFEGYQENVYPYLEAADIVAGGVGLNAVSQEATMLGKVQLMPTIADWYEGIWFDKRNVLLYDPTDLDSLVAAARFAVQHPKELQRIATVLAATRDEYIQSLPAGGETYLRAFREIVAKGLNARPTV